MGRIDTLLGDITQVKADAIVNAANCTLLGRLVRVYARKFRMP